MAGKETFVHVTHEAVAKIGGIGAVLQGFFTSKAYLEAVGRSVLVGPLFSLEGDGDDRLGDDGQVLYSSIDGIENCKYAPAFRIIEKFYNVAIIYGTREFCDPQTKVCSSAEVLLFDVGHMNNQPIDEFKRRLYEEFGIQSDKYEHIWEFEQYVRLAPPAMTALKEIGAESSYTTIVAHEFMGIPTALAAMMDDRCDYRTIFYAHEVATIRRIIEKHKGHDSMFYNAMSRGRKKNLYIDDVFGDQSDYFKHSLVKAARHCDKIYAVGDFVAEELRFLSPDFETADINVVYNGIWAYRSSLEEKLASKERLRSYCERLIGIRPNLVFTHVTRLVKSKGLWRDIKVLRKLERKLVEENKTAVFFILSTEVAKRKNRDILRMEEEYNWPVAHREGYPDMSGGEAEFYSQVQLFNAQSRNAKIIFINQFGFDRQSCGQNMCEEMSFIDIRRGSDVEFGMSIYEPFGIAQLEPLTFGGICVVTNVCGCAGFVTDISKGADIKNVIIADYTDLDNGGVSMTGLVPDIDDSIQSQIESVVSEQLAKKIWSNLPKTEKETADLISRGYELANQMSWETVVRDYVFKERIKGVSGRQGCLCKKA